MLVLSKIKVPSLHEPILKHACFDYEVGPGCVSSLVAPPGYGKTICLASWLSGVAKDQGYPVVWVNFDRRDNECDRLWAHMVAALKPHMPTLKSEPLSPVLDESDLWRDRVERVASSLQSSKPLIMVWDSCDIIESPTALRLLESLIRLLPQHIQLFCAGRSYPSFLRHSGVSQCHLLPKALLFSMDELQRYCLQVVGLELSAQDAEVLHDKTGGWPALLQLAAEELRGDDNVSEGIRRLSGTDGPIADFFTQSVLNAMSAQQRAFAFATASLPKLSAQLCDEVLTDRNSARFIHEFSGARCLLRSIGGEGWYEYLPLLRAYLRKRQITERKAIHDEVSRRAAKWFEENDDSYEAIKQYFACEMWHEAATLIERLAPDYIMSQRFSELNYWFDTISPEIIEKRPLLLLFRASALPDQRKLRQSLPTLERAHMLIQTATDRSLEQWGLLSPTQVKRCLVTISVQRALAYRLMGHGSQAMFHARVAINEAAPWGCAEAEYGLAQDYHYNGDTSIACDWYTRAIEHAMEDHNERVVVLGLFGLEQCRWLRGELEQAMQEQVWVRDWMVKHADADSLYHKWQRSAAAEVLLEGLQANQALEQVRAFDDLAKGGVDVRERFASHLMMLKVLVSLSEFDQARGALVHLERLSQSMAAGGELWFPSLETLKVWVDLREGIPSLMKPWLSARMHMLFVRRGFLVEHEQLMLARLAVEVDVLDELPDVLQSIREAARRHRPAHCLQATLLLALVRHKAGNLEAAMQLVHEALNVGKEGFAFSVVGDSAFWPLLKRVQGKNRDYATSLMSKVSKSTVVESVSSLNLSKRELQVLRCLGQGMSNREIAASMRITVETVKSHARNIYLKIGVANRTEAMLKAREMGVSLLGEGAEFAG